MSRFFGCFPAGAGGLVLVVCGLAAGPVWGQGGLCANERLRGEQPFASGLGDCRAYEVVSPLAKDDNGVWALGSRAAVGGEAITYYSTGAFAEPGSALFAAPYLSRRGVAGWVTQNISPPYTAYQGHALFYPFEGSLFTTGLSRGVVESADTPLVSGQPVGYHNLYVADLETGSYELVTTATPPLSEYKPFAGADRNGDQLPEAEGGSSDLSHVVFQFHPEPVLWRIARTRPYLRVGRAALCARSTFRPRAANWKAKTMLGPPRPATYPEKYGNPWRAVSGDGSRVVFTGGENDSVFTEPIAGQVYVRENPMSGVEECSVAGDACTVEVSASQRTEPDPHAGKGLGAGVAWYRDASVDGERVFFTSRVELTNDADTGVEITRRTCTNMIFKGRKGNV